MADRKIARCFTRSRRRPEELGRLPGWSLPWTFTLPQVAVFSGALFLGLLLVMAGATPIVLIPLLIIGAGLGKAIRKVRIDDRSLTAGLGGWARWWVAKQGESRLAGRAADVVSGNAVIGADHSLWVAFEVQAAPYGLLADTGACAAAAAAVERMLESVDATRWKLMSTVEPVSHTEVAQRIAAASHAEAWDAEVRSETERLRAVPMTERRFWLWVMIGRASADNDAGAMERTLTTMGVRSPARATWIDEDLVREATEAATARASASLRLVPATCQQVRRLLDRLPTGNADLEERDDFAAGEYPHLRPGNREGAAVVGEPGVSEGASVWRSGEAQWGEPLKRMAVADAWPRKVAHASVVVSQLPDSWQIPGGGELLWRLDSLPHAWDWLIDVAVTPHAVATAKTRNQHRRLNSQIAQYEGDAAGVPPDLDNAIHLVEQQRQSLANQPNSDEFEATVVLSTAVNVGAGEGAVVAAGDELDTRIAHLTGLAQMFGITVVAPTGDQRAARKMWLPTAAKPQMVRHYKQFLLADGIAGLGPCLKSRLGDPQGALLGMADDVGGFQPVLIDPTLGPRAHEINASPKSPSIGIAGRLGSGKSVFCKRLMWTTLTMGGKVVVVDRSQVGEYVVFARALAAVNPAVSVEVIDVTDPNGLSIDPMRVGLPDQLAAETATRVVSFAGDLDPRSPVTTGISLLAGERPGTPLANLVAYGAEQYREVSDDAAQWRRLRDLLSVLGKDSIGGTMFDPGRKPANLGSDLVVLWAPGLSLAEKAETPSDVGASAVVFGAMAIARALTFADSSRFAAVLLDEAWSLFKDQRALTLIEEALRDGRKHQCAVWLASQSPSDFGAATELTELLGHVAMFAMENEQAAVAAARLAGLDSDVVAPVLTALPTGTCLWKDVAGRTGLVDVWFPANPAAQMAIDTTPESLAASAQTPQGNGATS